MSVRPRSRTRLSHYHPWHLSPLLRLRHHFPKSRSIIRGRVSQVRRMQTIEYTPEGAVTISYPTLLSSPLSLGSSIGQYFIQYTTELHKWLISNLPADEAFGSHPESLGIIVVRDLPSVYTSYRERLLKLAYQFAKLSSEVREEYADPYSQYRYISV
jgi:hypothetical protein